MSVLKNNLYWNFLRLVTDRINIVDWVVVGFILCGAAICLANKPDYKPCNKCAMRDELILVVLARDKSIESEEVTRLFDSLSLSFMDDKTKFNLNKVGQGVKPGGGKDTILSLSEYNKLPFMHAGRALLLRPLKGELKSYSNELLVLRKSTLVSKAGVVCNMSIDMVSALTSQFILRFKKDLRREQIKNIIDEKALTVISQGIPSNKKVIVEAPGATAIKMCSIIEDLANEIESSDFIEFNVMKIDY
jgi:hypothetical protein